MNNDRRFYVYAYVRLDNNTYFYIGKGTNNRCKRIDTRSTHFKNIINKVECALEIIADNLTEAEALLLEQEMIETLVFDEGYSLEFDGEKNQENHLVNCTYGGEGISGYKYTEDQCKKCARIGEQNGMYGRKGELNPNYGLKHTEEHNEKIRLNNPRSTKCYCIELDREFNSYREASKILLEEYNITCYHSAIAKVCEGERESCGRNSDNELINLHFIKI